MSQLRDQKQTLSLQLDTIMSILPVSEDSHWHLLIRCVLYSCNTIHIISRAMITMKHMVDSGEFDFFI
jgi:hypothetical protein